MCWDTMCGAQGGHTGSPPSPERGAAPALGTGPLPAGLLLGSVLIRAGPCDWPGPSCRAWTGLFIEEPNSPRPPPGMLAIYRPGPGGAGASASTWLWSPSEPPWHSPGPPRPPSHTCWPGAPSLPRSGLRAGSPRAGPSGLSAPETDREAPRCFPAKDDSAKPSPDSRWAS